MKWNTAGLSMALGRLNKALDMLYSFTDGVWTLRYAIERMQAPIVKEETEGIIDWNRRHFNRTSDPEGYEARLKAKRLYFINNLRVPKIVYDAVEAQS